ncbi:MAG: cytochrome oxidase assembly protein ShyY1 [Oleiphilaceae bacterium]|jgi:cytochrome oxidase assembly protein ShyY1
MTFIVFKKLPLKINIAIFMFSLLVFSLLIKLAVWQLDRAAQKETRLEKIASYQQQDAMSLSLIMQLEQRQEDLNDLPIDLTGSFNNQQRFLLDNQVYNGRLGYRVVQLFEDAQSGMMVLVNLGWLQGSIDRAFIPQLKIIEGVVSFKGNVRILEPPILLEEQILKNEHWPQRIQSIEIDKISVLLQKPLVPFIVYIDNSEALGYIKNWLPIVMPPEKHLGYAFQWFSLALAWLMLMLYAAYKSAITPE